MQRQFSFSHLRGIPTDLVKGARPVAKAFLWIVVLACANAGSKRLIAAEPQLAIPTVDATEDATVKTGIQYTGNGAKVSAFQVDLHYSHQAISAISATIGPAAAAAGKMLTSAVLSNGDIRFLVFGLNQTVIGSGGVINLKITMASEVEPGSYPLEMLNAVASDPNGNSVAVTVSSGKIVVPPPDN